MAVLKFPIGPNDHVQGDLDAPVNLVEYGDFECPHCGHAYWIIKRLQQVFGHDLCFCYRHFPLTNIHPHAELAAEASEAAGSQGRFWEMHEWLFENQDHLSPEHIAEGARRLGLDLRRFLHELETGVYGKKVRQDFVAGARSGVNGTPTLFINGYRHDADYEFETLVTAINVALTQAA